MTAIWITEELGKLETFNPLPSFWRGECLNLFSMGEVAVADCLDAMREANVALDTESTHPGQAARMRALMLALSTYRFAGHSKVAAARLEDWQHLYEHRHWLAHGVMTIAGSTTEFRLLTFFSGEPEEKGVRRYDRMEKRELLGRLCTVYGLMFAQFGQIQAACKRGDV